MDFITIFVFVLTTTILIGILVVCSCEEYVFWIKNNGLVQNWFDKWKETKKPKIWWIVWSNVLPSLGIIVHIVLSLIKQNKEFMGISFANVFIYWLILCFVYGIVKNFARYHHDKKEALCLPKESQEPKSAEEYFSISKTNESPKD